MSEDEITITAAQVEERLQDAKTDEDFRAVVAWLVDNGLPQEIAAEHVAVWRLAAAGERLPDSPPAA